jgi:hypothetical protein
MSKQSFRKWSTAQFRAVNEQREYPLWQRVAATLVLALMVVALVKACVG